MSSKKTIITCAVTGASLSPSMSPNLPITPAQIVEQSLDAVKAGAAIVHLHARVPEDGRPTNDVAVWRDIVSGIRGGSDAIVNMSASLGSTAEDRLSAVLELRPEIATVIVGSMNYGLFRKAQNQGISEFRLDWAKEAFGPKSYEIVTNNNFAKIDRMLEILIDNGIGIEFECYDVGHLYNLAHCVDRKMFKPPYFVQIIFGILGGIGADVENLFFMKRTADKLFGKDYHWSVLAAGRHQMPFGTHSIMMGGNVRVGLEDSLYIGRGKLAKSNAEQVAKIKRIIEELGYEAATPKEAREMLGLKGADRVKF
jgi:uncharacterized protein (DUF849 family)